MATSLVSLPEVLSSPSTVGLLALHRVGWESSEGMGSLEMGLYFSWPFCYGLIFSCPPIPNAQYFRM